MSTAIHTGGLIVKDPDATLVLKFDWDSQELEDGVTLAGTPTVTATRLSGVTTGLMTATYLGLEDGSRNVLFSLTGGTNGQKYRVTNHVVTDETPAQLLDASFTVLIQDK